MMKNRDRRSIGKRYFDVLVGLSVVCFPMNDETKTQISFVAIGKKFFDVLVFMIIVFAPIRNAAREKSR